MPEPPDFDKWTGDVRGTPDFRQIARDVFQSEDYDGDPIPEIEEALRQVWNARGAADAHAVEEKLATLTGWVSSEPYRQHLREAIEALNR